MSKSENIGNLSGISDLKKAGGQNGKRGGK
jgi:hypothetical protein